MIILLIWCYLKVLVGYIKVVFCYLMFLKSFLLYFQKIIGKVTCLLHTRTYKK